VRSLSYIVVGINEFYTSKKCPKCEGFVGQIEIRRLYCPKCKTKFHRDVLAGHNMARIAQSYLIRQKRPLYLQPVDQNGNYPWETGPSGNSHQADSDSDAQAMNLSNSNQASCNNNDQAISRSSKVSRGRSNKAGSSSNAQASSIQMNKASSSSNTQGASSRCGKAKISGGSSQDTSDNSNQASSSQASAGTRGRKRAASTTLENPHPKCK
ncbi:hypothetical protein BGX34_010837, partial [Mortierella sp. NVP85]